MKYITVSHEVKRDRALVDTLFRTEGSAAIGLPRVLEGIGKHSKMPFCDKNRV
jgi:hypothetical protein